MDSPDDRPLTEFVAFLLGSPLALSCEQPMLWPLMVVLGDRLASVSGEAGLIVLTGVLLAWLAVKLLRKRLPPHRPGRRSPARPRSGS